MLSLPPPLPGLAAPTPAEAERLLTEAERLGTFPAVYQNLPSSPDDRAGRFRGNLAHNLALTLEQQRLLDGLRSQSLQAVAVKGVGLTEALYPDLSWREVSDIDLVARREDVPAIYDALKAQGLQDVNEAWDSASLRKLLARPDFAFSEIAFRSRRNTLVELHWDWIGNGFPQTDPMEDRESYLAYLCRHAGKHFWISLKSLTDIELFLRGHAEDFDWDRFWLLARQSNSERHAAVSFELCADLFGRALTPALTRASSRATRRLTQEAAAALFDPDDGKAWHQRPAARLLRVDAWPQRLQRLAMWTAPAPRRWRGGDSAARVWTDRYLQLMFQALAAVTPEGTLRRRWRRASELTSADWGQAFEAARTLRETRARLRRDGLSEALAWARNASSNGSSETADSLRRLALLTDLAARYYPGSMTCLPRSIALLRLAAERGAAVELRIGFKMENGAVAGHAWVEYEGQILNDEPEHVTEYATVELGRPGVAEKILGGLGSRP